EEIVVLLDVLAVVALAAGQAKEPLLEDEVLAVPEGQTEAEALPVVGDAEQAILTPAVDQGAGVVVRERVPCLSVRRIVLAHRAPLALGKIRTPAVPAGPPLVRLGKSAALRIGMAVGGRHGMSILQSGRSWCRVHPRKPPCAGVGGSAWDAPRA